MDALARARPVAEMLANKVKPREFALVKTPQNAAPADASTQQRWKKNHE